MARAVFINYRGEDSHGYGALLYHGLKAQFGEDQVFLDAETIPAGADFVAELLASVRSARVLLAVIGPRWLTARDSAGRRRIDDPDDWIRRELTEAFANEVRVIPVLTDQAELPCKTELPDDIAALSRCQYRHLRRRESTAGLAHIIDDLISVDPVLASVARSRHNGSRPLPPAPLVDEQLRMLAKASWNQWMAAANDRRLLHPAPLPIRWRRSTAAVAGPVSAASYPRFDPLPGLTAVSGGELDAGNKDALHRIYGTLPSGRLLLIGKPGSGKSAAAILLLLDALRYRQQATTPEDQARIPVPVLFTLHGWDPGTGESVTDWMAGKLAETYPMFAGRAGRRTATDLLTAGRVAGFLDGLDEIPESVRPRVLGALADAPFRLVLLARTTEAVAAANHRPLAGAVALDLRPVDPADAAAYLLQPLVNPPPESWKTICDHLAGQTSALSEALNTPFALSLLRDVYGPTDPVDELLDVADIENHLLDQAIAAAYTPRPGHPQPRYTVATAQRTLRYLATQLTEHDTTDLAWWHIPTWTPHRARMIAAAVSTVLANELIYGLGLGLVFGLALGLLAGLIIGSITLFAASAGHWREVPIMPRQITRLTYRSTTQNLMFGLLSGFGTGLLAGASTGFVFGLPAGLLVGLAVGLASGLAAVALRGIARRTDVEEGAIGPVGIWRHDRNVGLVSAAGILLMTYFLAVLADMLVPGLASALASRLSVVLPLGLLVGLVFGLVFAPMAKRQGTAVSSPGASAIDTALASMRLAIRHKTPLRLITFLEDARSRHLLRTVGPVYQFRHDKLQARLAQADPDARSPAEVH